jgi:hypothetical protein
VLLRLVGPERAEADHPGADAVELREVVAERALGPRAAPFPQRGVHPAVLVASEKRNLESHAAALVAGVAVLALLRRVAPPVRRQQRGDAAVVVQPDGEIVVRSRHRSRVEVDRPAAEQPVLDPVPLEQLVDPSQRSELLPLAHARGLGGSCPRLPAGMWQRK